MIVPEGTHVGFGQLRPAGPEINEYSRVSVWPPAFPREDQLIRRGKLVPLQPPTIVENWPTITQPPNIPSSEGEDRRIKREMNRVLWPRTDEGGGPWSLNEPRSYSYPFKQPGQGFALGQASPFLREQDFITMGQADAREFPFMEAGVFGAGAIAAYVGYKHGLPIPQTFGLMAVLGGGLMLLKRITS